MKILSCASVRRRLDLWHDGELSPAEQCAIDQHLADCPPCAAEARALVQLGDLIRDGAASRALSEDAAVGLKSGVLARRSAEDAMSWPTQLSELFQDMHLVWAGLSATAATAICLVLLLGIAHFSPAERADSLSGILGSLAAAPGSDRNPVALRTSMRPPRSYTDDVVQTSMLSSAATEEDLVLALAAVVTQEGRVARSELLLSNRSDREVVLQLMNAVAAARFQPASVGGEPVAVNLVWLITHTTVRAKAHS